MKMESLNGLCYKMGEYECCGTDHHESKISRATNGSSAGSRRKNRWGPCESPNRSAGSLLTTMEQFVQTVDDMNETILVPCRLMDVKFDSAPAAITSDPKSRLLNNLNGVDLFQFYTILNSVKSDLMWGTKSRESAVPVTVNPGLPACSSTSSLSVLTQSTGSASSASSTTGSNGEVVKGHVRRPSTVSTTSSASVSDTEFSELNDDSGLEGEDEYSQHMSDAFHHHLTGLQQCIRDLTLGAKMVTSRYNNDLGGASI